MWSPPCGPAARLRRRGRRTAQLEVQPCVQMLARSKLAVGVILVALWLCVLNRRLSLCGQNRELLPLDPHHCKGKHTCKCLVWSARRQRRATNLRTPPPRTEEQPQACSVARLGGRRFDGVSVAKANTPPPSQRQTHLQVPGWSARWQRRARSLSPPPPRTEEQPQACSIRCSFDVGSLKRQSHTHLQVPG